MIAAGSSRRCAGWRTCSRCGNCPLWAVSSSIFIALPSARFRSRSCSTLTTPLTPCNAASKLRLFNAHYDEYAFQRSYSMGVGRIVSAILRAAGPVRGRQRRRRILIRANSHYCSPQVIDWCRANHIDFILGLALTKPCAACRGSGDQHALRLEMKTQIRLHLPTFCPDQRVLRVVLSRTPQLATQTIGRRPKQTR